MINKRQKRRYRGKQRKLINVINKEMRQLNNIFSTSANIVSFSDVHTCYNPNGEISWIIIDDPLATQPYDKDKAVKWYNETFAKLLDDVTTIDLEDDIAKLVN